MNISVDYKRLLDLENAYNKMLACEHAGIDNWEGYDIAMENYEERTELSEYGIEKELRWNKNDNVYYNNNPAKFVSYLSEKMAVVVVEAFPDFENADVSLCCDGCQIGDSDNKLSCKCDDLGYLLESIEESTNPTYIPLIVDVARIFKNAIVITEHKFELNAIEEKKKIILEKTKQLTMKNIELESKIKELEEKKKALEELSDFNCA
jgi:hypothetical protein